MANTASGVVTILVLVVLACGLVYSGVRVGLTPAAGDREEVSRVAIAPGVAGAVLLAVGVFLPRYGPHHISHPDKSTLIQSADGWIFLALAASIVVVAFIGLRRGAGMPAMIVAGLVALGVAVYEGTGERLVLTSSGEEATERTDPGAGIYAVGVGGALAIVGGAGLMGWGLAGDTRLSRRVKRYP